MMAPAAPTLAELRASVEAAGKNSHATQTKETYLKSWRAWVLFCGDYGYDPLPATGAMLGEWAALQEIQGRAPSTVSTRCSAIRTLHTRPDLAGLPMVTYPPPDLGDARVVLKRLKRERALSGMVVNQAEAMLLSDLRRIKFKMAEGKAAFSRAIDLRDWALLTLAFALGGRRSELSCLDIEHVALDPDDDQWMMVRICTSKTDQDGNGEVVMIKRATDPVICPVAAVFAWLAFLRMKGITAGPLFRQCAGQGTSLTQSGMADGTDTAVRLSGQAICLRFTRRSLQAEIPNSKGFLKRFTGHSARRGAATEAARHGATHMAMCTHFRWKQGSRMATHYVEQADKKENNPIAAVM